MFERFTRGAREVVAEAQVEARTLGAPAVGAEHLLLAALRRCAWKHRGLPAAERVRSELVAVDPDAEALAAIGISLAAVRRSVEDAFGPDVWTAPRGPRRLPFTKEAKRALELALREALELGLKRIDERVVLLGVLREGETARRLLTDLGCNVDGVYELLRLEYARLPR